MFSIKDIIDIAIQIERNGESVFRDAVKTISNPSLASTLRPFIQDQETLDQLDTIIAEENRHAQLLQELIDAN